MFIFCMLSNQLCELSSCLASPLWIPGSLSFSAIRQWIQGSSASRFLDPDRILQPLRNFRACERRQSACVCLTTVIMTCLSAIYHSAAPPLRASRHPMSPPIARHLRATYQLPTRSIAGEAVVSVFLAAPHLPSSLAASSVAMIPQEKCRRSRRAL